ncbi:MAG TPA: hypothetical protein VIN61_08580 [Gammaproteobacteria bacterium]
MLAGLVLTLPLAVSAQTPDPLEPFLGTWSGVFTTQDHEYWTFADIQCFVGCPLEYYQHLSALLEDPANDSRPAMALAAEAQAAWQAAFEQTLTALGRQVRDANTEESDPKFLNCQPYGFVREATNPLPLRISRDGEHLLIRYEEWSLMRPIYMDGRPHPTHRTPTLLGHSVGRVESGELVVETARVTPDRISDASRAGHSGELTAVERYTVREDPRRLELTLTLTDPVMLARPLVITKTWLYTPDVELLQDSCGQQPGKP